MLASKTHQNPRRLRVLALLRAGLCLALGAHVCLVCMGCGGGTVRQAYAPPSGSYHIAGVPFYAEDSHQCGPASLAALLAIYGKKVSPQQVARAVYRPGLKGSLNLDLMLYARSQGLCADWRQGSPQDLAERLGQGQPLLVMVDNGLGPVKKLHYMVVTGYSSQAVQVNSGLRQGMQITWPDFLSAWGRTDYAVLLVRSPGKGGCP